MRITLSAEAAVAARSCFSSNQQCKSWFWKSVPMLKYCYEARPWPSYTADNYYCSLDRTTPVSDHSSDTIQLGSMICLYKENLTLLVTIASIPVQRWDQPFPEKMISPPELWLGLMRFGDPREDTWALDINSIKHLLMASMIINNFIYRQQIELLHTFLCTSLMLGWTFSSRK